MRSCFDDLAEQAEKIFKAGVPVEETVERYVVPTASKITANSPGALAIGRTTEQLYAEWSGKPLQILNYS